MPVKCQRGGATGRRGGGADYRELGSVVSGGLARAGRHHVDGITGTPGVGMRRRWIACHGLESISKQKERKRNQND